MTNQSYNAEARFLRAFAYYYALDAFGNVPFADESVLVGDDAPPRILRADLFTWLETELKELETARKERDNDYVGEAPVGDSKDISDAENSKAVIS